jgi:hypothetical protein
MMAQLAARRSWGRGLRELVRSGARRVCRSRTTPAHTRHRHTDTAPFAVGGTLDGWRDTFCTPLRQPPGKFCGF